MGVGGGAGGQEVKEGGETGEMGDGAGQEGRGRGEQGKQRGAGAGAVNVGCSPRRPLCLSSGFSGERVPRGRPRGGEKRSLPPGFLPIPQSSRCAVSTSGSPPPRRAPRGGHPTPEGWASGQISHPGTQGEGGVHTPGGRGVGRKQPRPRPGLGGTDGRTAVFC